ncbi:MAG: outer membrane beta-barrel protein [Alphaproteobacteria bacterium]|nr:outer membrane beta-barrel protein [Alphaproteobacteria bacterium]
MIRTSSALALSALVLSCYTGGAGAADIYDSTYGARIKDSYASEAWGNSRPTFYLRLDGLYGEHDAPVMVEDGIYDLKHEQVDGAWGIGGGVGTYFTPNLRGDVTVERRFETDASGALLNRASGIGGVREFGLESTLVMFNAYYDFDSRSHFTPYLGVGLGYIYNETKDGSVALTGGGTGTVAGAGKSDAAGALMAGVSVALLDRVKLDVGYRFLYMGEATTGPVVVTTPGGGRVASRDPTVEDLHAHEVKFGLRYDWN